MNATRDRCHKYFYRVCLEMQGDEGTLEPQIKRDSSDFVFEMGQSINHPSLRPRFLKSEPSPVYPWGIKLMTLS
jgi:hypothetical protein